MNRDANLALMQLDSYEHYLENNEKTQEAKNKLVELRENVIKALDMHAQGVTSRQLAEADVVWDAFNRLAKAEHDLRGHKGDQAAQLLQKVREERANVEKRARQVLSRSAGAPDMRVKKRAPEESAPATAPKIPAQAVHPDAKRPRPNEPSGSGSRSGSRSGSGSGSGSGEVVDLTQDTD